MFPEPRLWLHLEDLQKATADVRREGIRQVFTDHNWRFLCPVHLRCWNEGLGYLAGGMCRRIARLIGIDDGVGCVKAAERACTTLEADDVDLILASGPPFSACVLAERLSRRLRCSYVLDYRDPWTEIPEMIRVLHPIVLRR